MNERLNEFIVNYEKQYKSKLSKEDIRFAANADTAVRGKLDEVLEYEKDGTMNMLTDDPYFVLNKIKSINNTEKTLKVYVEEYKLPLLVKCSNEQVELSRPNVLKMLYRKEKMSIKDATEKINTYDLHKIEVKENTKIRTIAKELNR